MKSTLAILSLVFASSLTACGAAGPDETDTNQAALTGVEPDEIDVATRAATPTPGVEPDELATGSTSTGGATGATTAKPKPAITYGPVITIKPKG